MLSYPELLGRKMRSEAQSFRKSAKTTRHSLEQRLILSVSNSALRNTTVDASNIAQAAREFAHLMRVVVENSMFSTAKSIVAVTHAAAIEGSIMRHVQPCHGVGAERL